MVAWHAGRVSTSASLPEPPPPRPTPPGPSSTDEHSGDQPESLRAKVPLPTLIVLVGVMLLFLSGAILYTLQAHWLWWLIPAIIAVPVVLVLGERAARVNKVRNARLALETRLRNAGRSGGS